MTNTEKLLFELIFFGVPSLIGLEMIWNSKLDWLFYGCFVLAFLLRTLVKKRYIPKLFPFF